MSPCASRMIDVDAAGIDVSIIAFADVVFFVVVVVVDDVRRTLVTQHSEMNEK